MDKDGYMALVRRMPALARVLPNPDDDVSKLFRVDGKLLNAYLEVLRNHGISPEDMIIRTSNSDAYKGFCDTVKS